MGFDKDIERGSIGELFVKRLFYEKYNNELIDVSGDIFFRNIDIDLICIRDCIYREMFGNNIGDIISYIRNRIISYNIERGYLNKEEVDILCNDIRVNKENVLWYNSLINKVRVPKIDERGFRLIEVKYDEKYRDTGNLTYEIYSNRYIMSIGCNRKTKCDIIIYVVNNKAGDIDKVFMYRNREYSKMCEGIIDDIMNKGKVINGFKVVNGFDGSLLLIMNILKIENPNNAYNHIYNSFNIDCDISGIK